MEKPKTYTKKPVSVLAMHLTRDNVGEVAKWCGGRVVWEPKSSDPTDVYIALDIPTLEGTMRAETHSGGDYVIRGVEGEFYPCKPSIFGLTYTESND